MPPHDRISDSAGSLSVSAPSPATFEGRSAFLKTETLAGTMTVANVATPYSATKQLYFDAANNPLGSNGDAYVVAGAVTIPVTARVGDSGIWYAADVYTSSAKTVRSGAAQVSFSVLADTATTALLSVLTEERNTAGQLVSTKTLLLRITSTGDVTRVSESSVDLSSNTNLAFSY